MKAENFPITRYDADEGKVFDWKNLEEHITVDEDGNEIQDHLYVTTIFIGGLDSIDNYIEVDKPTE